MELGFILKALQRYWWLMVLFALLGAAAGVPLSRAGKVEYSAAALIEVLPPTAQGITPVINDDRYLSGEQVILGSSSLAAEVAKDFDELTAAAIHTSVKNERLVGTNVVRLIATRPSAAQARDLANAYANRYITQVTARIEPASTVASALDDAIKTTKDALDGVDGQIQTELKPYIDAARANPALVVPTIDQVDPKLGTQRAVLVDQYQQLLSRQNQASIDVQRVNSSVIESAELPAAASGGTSKIILAAAPIVGLLLGAVVAVGAARLSARVLDAEEVTDLLGVAVAGTLPKNPVVGKRGLAGAFRPPDRALVPALNEMCVLAESRATDGEACSIVVTGTQRSSGISTTAALMAGWFARRGASVILIDCDVGKPELTSHWGGGVDGVKLLPPKGVGEIDSERSAEPTIEMQQTPVKGLQFLGLVDRTRRSVPRRRLLDEVHTAAKARADIVIFDGGPLFEASSAVQLTLMTDAVILAVPILRQRARTLEVAGRELVDEREKLLPVLTYPRARKASPRTARTSDAQTQAATTTAGAREGAPEAAGAVTAGGAGPTSGTRWKEPRGSDRRRSVSETGSS